VLVRLDHEKGRRPEARARLEVRGHTADQEPGLESRVLEDPGKERGSGGLAVRARHREHPAIAQYLARQPLRTRCIGNAAVEQRLDDRLPARHDIANDDDIRRGVELRGIVAFDQLYPERLELCAHRRIDVAVGPRDTVPRGTPDRGDAAHEGPANSKNVYMHNRRDSTDHPLPCCSTSPTLPPPSPISPRALQRRRRSASIRNFSVSALIARSSASFRCRPLTTPCASTPLRCATSVRLPARSPRPVF